MFFAIVDPLSIIFVEKHPIPDPPPWIYNPYASMSMTDFLRDGVTVL